MEHNVQAEYEISVDGDNGLGALVANDIPLDESESAMLRALCGDPPFVIKLYLKATREYAPATRMEPAEDCIVDEGIHGLAVLPDQKSIGYWASDSCIADLIGIKSISDLIDEALINAEWERAVTWEESKEP